MLLFLQNVSGGKGNHATFKVTEYTYNVRNSLELHIWGWRRMSSYEINVSSVRRLKELSYSSDIYVCVCVHKPEKCNENKISTSTPIKI